MSHGVLALGGAALCLSGSVWYVPAWADLRAGPDRPASRRPAATAVLLLWAGASAATAVLAWAGPRAALACAVAAGLGAGGTALAARARAGRERRGRPGGSCWAPRPRNPPRCGPGGRCSDGCSAGSAPPSGWGWRRAGPGCGRPSRGRWRWRP
ncbi:hypothetical protein [Streptomyces albidoflavus]|uniref:hypothetical protein n=1 Tax=Streptomyces albidoflavus TaxID=1886 RepID=UPI001E52ED8B|nr:hypothetical protein [Streptomyces albidoflavus]